PSVHAHLEAESPDDVIDFVCGPDRTPVQIAKSSVLCEFSEKADEVNEKMLARLEGEVKSYRGIDMSLNGRIDSMPEWTMKETPAGFPPFELRLKVGAIVYVLKDLDPSNGLWTGVRLMVTQLGDELITCERIGDCEGDRVVVLSKCKFETDHFYRNQFPLRLAYAMTLKD
ncbi:hypothetical protein PFISCL1PPCAC_22048, partial [Pristionchus fissidentatus]